MAEAEIIPLGEAVQEEIRREFAKAKVRFGDSFEVLCLEGSWGDTLDDRQTLRMLRYSNRSGSMYREVMPETPFKAASIASFRPNPAATSSS